jgi:hypothetical protein
METVLGAKGDHNTDLAVVGANGKPHAIDRVTGANLIQQILGVSGISGCAIKVVVDAFKE